MTLERALEKARYFANKTNEKQFIVKELGEFYNSDETDLKLFFEGKLRPIKTVYPSKSKRASSVSPIRTFN